MPRQIYGQILILTCYMLCQLSSAWFTKYIRAKLKQWSIKKKDKPKRERETNSLKCCLQGKDELGGKKYLF